LFVYEKKFNIFYTNKVKKLYLVQLKTTSNVEENLVLYLIEVYIRCKYT